VYNEGCSFLDSVPLRHKTFSRTPQKTCGLGEEKKGERTTISLKKKTKDLKKLERRN
jgi:hypothetical protein